MVNRVEVGSWFTWGLRWCRSMVTRVVWMELGLVCSNQVYLGTEVVSQYGHQGGLDGVGVGVF